MTGTALQAAILAEGFVGSPASRMLIAAMVAVAAATLVGSVAVVFGRSQARIERRIAGYEMPEAASMPAGARPLRPSAVVQQVVDLTGAFAEKTGILLRTERLLQQADVPLRAAEVLFYVPAAAVIGALTALLLGSPVGALLVLVVVGLGPLAVVQWRAEQRIRAFERQLPDTLNLLAGALRAGFSFLQGLETVAEETIDPMRRELQLVLNEARLGRPLEESLGAVAVRMRSRDLEWAVMAIAIQREVGGNLAALLDTVADTMTKRERLRREIGALTAEGRLSGIVLSIFPPAFAVVLYLIQPEYIERLFNHSIGIVSMIGAAVLSVLGWLWLRKIVDIEV